MLSSVVHGKLLLLNFFSSALQECPEAETSRVLFQFLERFNFNLSYPLPCDIKHLPEFLQCAGFVFAYSNLILTIFSSFGSSVQSTLSIWVFRSLLMAMSRGENADPTSNTMLEELAPI
jgi:hypothetical protein